MKKILLFQQYFPHYRGGTLNKFLELQDLEWHFAGMQKDPDEPSIAPWVKPSHVNINKITAFNFLGIRFHKHIIKWAFSDIDIIILVGNAKWPSVWLTAIFSRIMGKKVIFWSHGWLNNKKSISSFIKWVFFNIANGLIFYNKRASLIMKEKGYKGKIYTIYNSVNKGYAEIDESSLNLKLKENYNYLVSVARLIPSRNYEFLFRTLKELSDHNIGLILAGDGEDKLPLITLAKNMNLEVVFTGPIYSNKNLEKIYKSAFASIMTGRVGLSIIQSLQHGVPVIAYSDADDQHPEFEVLIDSHNSFLFEKNNIESLKSTIIRSLNDPIDNYEKNCIESVDPYNPEFQKDVIKNLVKGLF